MTTKTSTKTTTTKVATERARGRRAGRTDRKRAARIGRPSKLTPQLRKKVVEALRDGNYRESVALYVGVSTSCFSKWMARGRTEADRIYEAEEALAAGREGVDPSEIQPLEDEAIYLTFFHEVMEAEATSEVEAVQFLRKHMSTDTRAVIEFLQRKFPERWRKPERLEVSGPGGGPIQSEEVSSLSGEQQDRELVAFGLGAATAMAMRPEDIPAPEQVD